MLHINVLGLVTIAPDVTAELARATIASIAVLGAFHASQAVRNRAWPIERIEGEAHLLSYFRQDAPK
ncbi:MAG: hypothetical protein WDN04_22660 [Rhodospirillales bacterium]